MRLCSSLRLGWLLLTLPVLLASSHYSAAFNADLYTSGTNRYLWLDNLITAAPIGTKLWVVADLNGNGINTNVTANGLVQGDDFLLFERFVDGTLFGSQTGRFREFGLSVDDLFLNANIYVYLWNTNAAAENGGDTFGILNLGVITPPPVGNAQWVISSNITANTYTLRGFTTNIWNAPNSGLWSDGGNWATAPAVGGTSDTLLVFGGASDYSSTNDLAGQFLMNVLSFGNSGNVTLSGNTLKFTNQYGVPLIQMNGDGNAIVGNDIIASSDMRLEGNGTGIAILSGVVSGIGGLTKVGSSTFVLSNANTFSSTSVIAGGTLLLGNNNALSTNEVTFTNGVLAAADSSARSISNAFRIGDVIFGQGSGGTGDLVLVGNIDLTSPFAQRTLQIDNSLTEFRGTVSNGGILKTGTGTLLLSGTNTFTNGIYITDGTLRAGSSGALNPTTPSQVSIDAGALEIYGINATIGRLTGYGGTVRNGAAAAAILTLDTEFNDFFLGNIEDGGSGSLKIIKTGSGSQSFDVDNTYSGGTEIRSGSMQVNTLQGLGTGSITLGNAQLTLRYESDATFGSGPGYAVTVTNAATINIGNASGSPFNIERTLSIGALNIGTNVLTIASPNTFFLGVNGGVNFTNSTIDTEGGGLIVLGNSSLIGTNTFTGDERIFLGGLTNALGTNGSLVVTTARGMGISNLVVMNGTNTFNVSSQLALDGRLTNGATAGRLVKSGAGTLNITNLAQNTYTGGTVINGGSVVAASGSNFTTGVFVTQPFGTGSITMNGGTLTLLSDQNVTNGTGSGYDILATAPVTIAVDRLAAGSNRTNTINSLNWGTNTLTVAGSNGYMLRVNGSTRITNVNVELPSSGVTFAYGNNLFLMGLTNTFNGFGNFRVFGTTTNATNMTLVFNSSGSATFGSVVINGVNTYQTEGGLTVGAVGQTVANSSIIKTGSGLLTFSANSTFTGGVEVRNGAIQLNSATALGTATNVLVGAATINLRNNSATLFGPGTGYTVTLTNNATIDVRRASGTGTSITLALSNVVFNGRQLTVTGANAYSLALSATNWNGIDLAASSAAVLFTNSSTLSGMNRFSGSSLVRFDRTNTFANGSLLDSSTSGGLIVSNPVLNGTLSISNTANVSLNGILADGLSTGTIDKRGSGVLFLTNFTDNTFSGGINLYQGSLRVAGDPAVTTPMGVGPVNLSGGTLQLRADVNTTFGPGSGYTLNLISNSTISVDRLTTVSSNMVLSLGGVSGPGGLTVNNANGYILAFNNNAIWSNSTINAASLLQYAGTVDAYATNTITGFIQSLGGFFLNGPVTLSNGSGLTLFGTIADGTQPGQLIKIGSGTLSLTNLENQTYTGGTVLRSGIIAVAGGTNNATSQFITNPLGTGPIYLQGGTLNLRADTNLTWGGVNGYDVVAQSNATISLAPLSANPNSITNQEFRLGTLSNFANLTISQGSNFSARFLGSSYFSNSILTANATSVLAGPIVLDGTARFAGNRDIFFGGLVSEATAGAILDKDGSARLYMTNLSNPGYSGGTIIRGGQLRVHSDAATTNPLGSGSNVTMFGGTLELRDSGDRTLGPSGGYNFIIAGTNATATIDVNRYTGSANDRMLTVGGVTITNNGILQTTGGNNWVLRFSGGLQLGSTTNRINVNNSRSAQTYAMEIQGPITASVPGAQFIKFGGANELGYTSTNIPDHSGGTFIMAGSGGLTWRPNALAGGTYGFGTGDIYLNSGAFRFQNNQTANYTFTNNVNIASSLSISSGRTAFLGGTLDFTGQGNNPTMTNTGALQMGGQLVVTIGTGGGYGTNRYGLAFTGPLTVRSDDQTLFVNGSGGGVDDRVVFFGNVGSDNGQRHLTVAANNSSKVEFAGTNSALGGMSVIRGYAGNVGAVMFASTNSLPASRVSVAPGAAISIAQQAFLTGANTNFASLTNWFDLANGSVVLLHSTNRTSYSQTYDGQINLSGTGLNRDIRVGVAENYTITVTNNITPYASKIRLVAGGGLLILNRTNQMSGAGRLEIGPGPGLDADEIVSIAQTAGGTLRLQQSNSYSGGTLINLGATAGVRGTNVFGTGDVDVYGLLAVEAQGILLPTAGVATNRNRLTLHPTGELRLENNDAVNTNRFADTETLALNGGLLRMLGRALGSNTTYEYITNVVTLGGGRIQMDSRNASTNILHLGSLTRGLSFSGITNGTIQLVPNGNGSMSITNRLILNNADSLVTSTNGMLAPWIVNQTTGDYLAYNSATLAGFTNGVTNFVNYRALLTGAATGDVVNITTFSNLAADTTIYALRMGNNTRLTNNSGANDRTLTLLSGGLLVAGAATNDAHLLFRDASGNAIEGLIYNSSTLRLSGTNHAAYITKFGDGTLIAGSQQTGYTNGWNINRGTLEANLATGVVGTGGTNYAFGAAVPENFINLNGNTTLRLTTVATNQVYASGKITSWDNNIISASFGNQDDRRIYFAPLGMDLNSISNGPLGTQLRVDLERTRSELRSLGLVTLNADTIFNIRDTGTASGNTGSTNRLILDGGLNSTNRIIVKYGNGVLELPGDNNTTMVNNQIRVTGGALSVGHNGALGDVNSSITIITNSVLELNVALTDFTPIATVNQQAGSAERWLGQYNRFTNDNTLETYSVPTNVTLQISATHNNAAGSNNLYKTIRLQGGGLEGYQFNGDNRSTTLTISNQIEFTSDLQIGRSGIDAGRATVVSVFNGSFTEINPGLDFVKVGGDIVQLGGGAKNYTGDTIVRSGELRNGVANAVRTTSLLNVEANGIFNLNNFAQTIAGLSGSGMVTNSGTGAAEGLTLNFAGTQVFSGAIGGIMALTNNGPGTQVLSGRTTFTGNTAVSSGALELTSDGALGGTAQIQIATGGTLLLSGSPANRINDLAGMNLAGGTFNSGGLAESLGALTLSASSTIDLGSGASTLSFTSGTRTAGSLTIDNWSGSLAGGGTDQLRFDSALDSTFLANINFTGFDLGALQISFGSYVEIVPVPEPATILGSLALASLGLWRERRRLRHWLKR